MKEKQSASARAILGLFTAGLVIQAQAGVGIVGGLNPVTDSDFYFDANIPTVKVELGRLLFFDSILSGNRNISCATCHHPALGTSDGVSLTLGEGAVGLGPERVVSADQPVLGRVPRNSQALYFLGARSFERLFHDGRVEFDPDQTWASGFWSPAREQLPTGLDNVLAAQAMFPVTSDIEMAGHKGENEIADAVSVDRLDGQDGAWNLIAQRLRAIPEYVDHFRAAFAHVDKPSDIRFVDAANAIAAFETIAFRADGSPFDTYLESGDPGVLGARGSRGMALFYDKARCSNCHSGKFQTDQAFHAIAMPQIGPGKNDGLDQSYWQETGLVARMEDYGRFRVTRNPEDRYKFRTPTLRNVELTGPWGHGGAYDSLEDAVRHHLNAVRSLHDYEPSAATLPPLPQVIEKTAQGSQLVYQPVNPARLDDYHQRDGWVQSQPGLRQNIAAANELEPSRLSDEEVTDLLAFLKTLTDPSSRDHKDLVPKRVPSNLAVAVTSQAE